MSSYAEVDCVLKVNVRCKACTGKLHEVLSSISGVYSITIDAEEGLAKIIGEMDPNVLLFALSRNGKHAEIKSIKLKSPKPKSAFDKNVDCCSNGLFRPYGCGKIPYEFRERRALPQAMWHETNRNYYDPYYSSYYDDPYAYRYPFRH